MPRPLDEDPSLRSSADRFDSCTGRYTRRMLDKIKRNWNKEPLVPHKRILDVVFIAYGFMAVVLLVVGVNVFVSLFVPAVILGFCYLTARLSP